MCDEKSCLRFRFQSTFKKQEVAAIESCVNKMLRSDTFTLSMTECVALVKKAMSKMSYADARSFVYKIIDGSYFVLTSSEESDNVRSFNVFLDLIVLRKFHAIDFHFRVVGTTRIWRSPWVVVVFWSFLAQSRKSTQMP